MKKTRPEYTDAELADLAKFADAYAMHNDSAAMKNAQKVAVEGTPATTVEQAVIGWATWTGIANSFPGPERRTEMNATEMEEWWTAQEKQGLAPVPHLVDERATMIRVALHVAWAARDLDDKFFKRIATLLQAKHRHFEKEKREKKGLSNPKPLTARQLHIAGKRGRGTPPHVLKFCFPPALCAVMNKRLHNSGGGLTRKRITRDELKISIQNQQNTARTGDGWINVEGDELDCISFPNLAQDDHASPISEFELSRWINEAKFERFMAEQRIAKKRPK